MKRLIMSIGFWLSYPAQFVYLRMGSRTRVLIVVGDSALMMKGWLGTGQWSLPGGGLHRGEDPVLGALREVSEETGITLKANQLQFLYKTQANTKGIRFWYSCFTVELPARPEVKKQFIEVAELDWVALDKVSLANASPDAYQAVQAWLTR